ncbi:MAG: PTS system mannose/fructose/sorbose family transporter subunit IID, partial [Desulfovibrionaceae bacterium]|nr:PTS system mannose/fructose/sorbose family transporter subunit IID [Desulfovibrionaceae bacterium]
MLPAGIALNCLARTFCINAAVTARGMQQIGLAFVLAPALCHLYPDAGDRTRAFARYGGHSNTHVFMIPLYVGIVLSLEGHIARASLPESAPASLRDTLGTTLSALGDSLFSGTLLPLWALGCICLILAGHQEMALFASLALWVLLTVTRILSFFMALRHGIAVLAWLKKLDLINWADRLKYVNAVLIALIIWQMGVANGLGWQLCAAALTLLPLAAWLVGRLRLPRILLWAAFLGM